MRVQPALLLAALAACLCGPAHGDPRAAAQVDALFTQWDKSSSPGCSLAIFQHDEIVYKRGYGMADLGRGIAITPSTVFHVASVSKQFTAAAVVLLAEEGKVSLDDPVRRYVPELPDLGTPITIRQLVHHTSGLRDQWELLNFSGWRYSQDLITDDDVMSLVKRQQALNFAPGSRYAYSNTGYTLLAQIVARVSGKSFREFTTERFFQPLGMDATHFRDDFSEVVPNSAHGYVRTGDVFKLSVTNFNTVGATSLLTTVEDLAKWDASLHRDKLGGAGLLRQMLERGVLNDGRRIDYAFGLTIRSYRGAPTVGHSGADAGYRAYLVRFPQQRFGVACACNAGDASPVAISEKIADIYLADALQPMLTHQTVDVPESKLSSLAGVYVRLDGREAQRVFLKEGRLVLTGPDDEYATALRPVGGNRFMMGERRDAVEFAEAPLRLTLINEWTNQESQVFERSPAFEPDGRQLEQYAGTYLSEEIDLPYRFAVDGGVLVMSSMKLGNGRPLQPFTRDLFGAGDLGTLRFTRDRLGRISGFLANSSRVVDLRFWKRNVRTP